MSRTTPHSSDPQSYTHRPHTPRSHTPSEQAPHYGPERIALARPSAGSTGTPMPLRMELGTELGNDCDRLWMAQSALASSSPDLSARSLLTRGQTVFAWCAVAVLFICLVLSAKYTAIVLIGTVTLVYLAALAYRLLLFRRGLAQTDAIEVSNEQASALTDDELPSYTVLIPAFDEPQIDLLMANLRAIDYPADKLDLRLMLEAGDAGTIRVAEQACAGYSDGPGFTIIQVPAGEPQTKPRACNYGLLGTTSELVTIYDAEDQPDPLQLRRAAYAFAQLPSEYVCLQAQLGFYNSTQNLLTKWFTLDYGAWFAYLLPGLAATGSPIPLGGTSNHFRAEVLRRVGGWDPWNVTEDADLGLRLHRMGYRVGVLKSDTMEEANPDPINWVRQRSRWYKGYIQTFLVHLRHPRQAAHSLGRRGLTGLILFIGGTPILSALNGLFWAMALMWFLAHQGALAALFPTVIYYPALISGVFGNFLIAYMNIYAVRVLGRPQLLVAALLSPLYWVLMWLAAVKALVQLVTNPSYWEKTTHGLAISRAAA